MQRNSQRNLTVAFLVTSFALSLVILSVRNLYDDEIASLPIITSSLQQILQINAHSDVHPPGMYLLAHLAYRLLPSFRWLNLFPALVTYAGLAFFLLRVTPLFTHTRSLLCFLLLATFHPQLLMWGSTFRWYGWWTGLALITLTIALQPGNPRAQLGFGRASVIGLLLAGLFYLNYITLLFAVALAAAMLLRYWTLPPKRLLVAGLLTAVVFASLIVPHLHTMFTVHLRMAGTQRSGLTESFLRLLQSIAASEACLPWHPLAICAGLLFAGLCACGLIEVVRPFRIRGAIEDWPYRGPLATLVLFGIVFFLLIAGTGLGGKPRGAVVLISIYAIAAAWVIDTLRPRVQDTILVFLLFWSATGAAHILGRYGLTKNSMTEHPEEVSAFIRQTSAGGCSIVITVDPELAFTLGQSGLHGLLVLSPFDPSISGRTTFLPHDCAHTTLYAVQSYVGGNAWWAHTSHDQIQAATHFIQGQPIIRVFGFDADATFKRRLIRIPGLRGDLASAAQLPDYNYVVTFGPVNPAQIGAIRSSMPDTVSD